MKKLLELLNRDAPAMLLALVALFGIGVAAYMVGVAVFAIQINATEGAVLAVLAVFAIGMVLAVLTAIMSPRTSFGGWAGLLAFMLGSVFTLFESRADMFAGRFAELTKWQAITWGLSVLIATAAMVVQAVRKHERTAPAVSTGKAELAPSSATASGTPPVPAV